MKKFKTTPLRHAHWLVTQAYAKPKPAKELAYPNAWTDRNNARNAKMR